MSKRSILVNFAILVPALALCAAVLSTVSCGGGLFPEVTATSTSSATPTPGTGEFGYVTDFNTGKVVKLTRNTSSGGITPGQAVKAGATQGPKGLALTFSNDFLYVANNKDNNVYAYSIQSNGVPSPLPTASFSDGSGSGPEQIAINPSSTLLWVTNGGSSSTPGSITFYAINSSSGELTNNGSLSGLSSPFGVITDGTYLYVADHGAGSVNSYTIDTSTGGLTLLSSVSNLGSGVTGGTPVKLAFDPSGSFIYVDDQDTGAVSSIAVSSGALSQAVPFFPSSSIDPIGLAIAQLSSGNFLLAAYQATNQIGSYLISPAGTLLTPNLSTSTNVQAPTGIVVDPQFANAYTANQNDGTVAQWTLTGSCGATVCFVGKMQTESGSSTSGPFDLILTH